MNVYKLITLGAGCDIFRSDEKQFFFSIALVFTFHDPCRGSGVYHAVGEV